MSLTVKHLNGDATFLLTFAPTFAPPNSKRKFPGSFTILIDPWLDGESNIYHRKFASSRHIETPAIKSLAEIEDEVDLIIISQEKADHLSKETLCTLPKDTNIRILATDKAAKKIRAWQYFQNPGIVQVMKPYEAEKQDTITRFPIEPYSSASADGEVTIANISEKGDITRLHNAIGITYCPPGTLLTSWDGTVVKLDDIPIMGKSGTTTPSCPRSPKYRDICGCPQSQDFAKPPLPPPLEELLPPFAPLLRIDYHQQRPSTSGSRAPAIRHIPKRPSNYESVTSTIYTPHGLSPSTLQPYIDHQLAPLKNALPVTALFHSLNTESNPWWLGGTVCAGAPGGVEIAHDVEAKFWLGAHDEVKEVKGWAAKWTKSRRYQVGDVVRMLRERDGVGMGRGVGTEVCVVGCGETMRLA